MNELHVGETYTRIEINKMLGGNIRDYMPISKDAVVCVCLTIEWNPDAPATILVGKGAPAVKAAQKFLEQSWTVPLFIKQRESEWEYKGNYRAVSAEKDPVKVAMLGAKAGRLDVVSALSLAQ
jgi:hypothetical protein